MTDPTLPPQPTLAYLPGDSAAGEEDPGASIDQAPVTPEPKAMHLVQILLPLHDNQGQALPKASFDAVKRELVARFGGLTAYARSPASGLWVDEQADGDQVVKDQLIVYEVMVEQIDRAWWLPYQNTLARRFGQQQLVIRIQAIELL